MRSKSAPCDKITLCNLGINANGVVLSRLQLEAAAELSKTNQPKSSFMKSMFIILMELVREEFAEVIKSGNGLMARFERMMQICTVLR